MANRDLYAIVALATNRVIGDKGKIPWKMPSDLKYFKETTMGHIVVAGYTTFASIPANKDGEILPGRTKMVLTRHHAAEVREKNAIPIAAIEEVLDIPTSQMVFVIGGEQIYTLALPYLTRIFMTFVHAEENLPGDTHFPELDSARDWYEVDRTKTEKVDPRDQYESTRILYQRRPKNMQ